MCIYVYILSASSRRKIINLKTDDNFDDVETTFIGPRLKWNVEFNDPAISQLEHFYDGENDVLLLFLALLYTSMFFLQFLQLFHDLANRRRVYYKRYIREQRNIAREYRAITNRTHSK